MAFTWELILKAYLVFSSASCSLCTADSFCIAYNHQLLQAMTSNSMVKLVCLKTLHSHIKISFSSERQSPFFVNDSALKLEPYWGSFISEIFVKSCFEAQTAYWSCDTGLFARIKSFLEQLSGKVMMSKIGKRSKMLFRQAIMSFPRFKERRQILKRSLVKILVLKVPFWHSLTGRVSFQAKLIKWNGKASACVLKSLNSLLLMHNLQCKPFGSFSLWFHAANMFSWCKPFKGYGCTKVCLYLWMQDSNVMQSYWSVM